LNKYDNLDLLLTTHYTKLCELLQTEHVQNMHMKIELCEGSGIKYLYKLDKGKIVEEGLPKKMLFAQKSS